MPHRAHSVRLGPLALLGAVALLAASCSREDPRVSQLSVGISKDSVTQAMGGPGERPVAYLMGGRYIEALMYRRPDTEGPLDELKRSEITPVVLVDGQLTGWTWKHWDSVAAENRIEVTPVR